MLEILNDYRGQMSMSKVLLLGSFLVSSWIMVVMVSRPVGVTDSLLGVYVGAYALSYVGGKFADKGAKDGSSNISSD